MSGQQMPAARGGWKSLRSKFFASGVIVLATIFITLMLFLPFISFELDEQIEQLRRDQLQNIRNEAITLARLLVFEFSRLQDLVDILYIETGSGSLEEAKAPIRNYLWEKVTFNSIIRDIELLDESGVIYLTPFGSRDTLPPETLEPQTDIRLHQTITTSELIEGDDVLYVFMPLYIVGNRWGLVKVSVSTEEIAKQLSAQIERQSTFRQLVIVLFFGALLVSSIVGVLVLNFLAHKVTDPLKTLSHNAAIFAESGDVSRLQEIEVENDEVGLLARNFNTMAEEIDRLLREKDEAYAQLKASQEQLRQSEKLATLGQLSGGIAHEINNALSPIRLRSEEVLMTIEEGGKAERDDLQVILKGIEQCSSIVQKLRDFAAPSLGERSRVDLNGIIRETIALVRRQIEKQRIAIELSLQPLPAVMANPGELEQVFMNMLLNSRDAILARGSGNGGTISISTESAGGVVATVRDNGVGMDDATMARMFEPFFTTKEVGRGTGLGMSVSFGILQSHGAEISVESAPGEGTAVIVRFPPADEVNERNVDEA